MGKTKTLPASLTIDLFPNKIAKRRYNKRKKKNRKGNKIRREREVRKSKLEVEEMLLMRLEYKRQYQTYFHIGINYGGVRGSS